MPINQLTALYLDFCGTLCGAFMRGPVAVDRVASIAQSQSPLANVTTIDEYRTHIGVVAGICSATEALCDYFNHVEGVPISSHLNIMCGVTDILLSAICCTAREQCPGMTVTTATAMRFMNAEAMMAAATRLCKTVKSGTKGDVLVWSIDDAGKLKFESVSGAHMPVDTFHCVADPWAVNVPPVMEKHLYINGMNVDLMVADAYAAIATANEHIISVTNSLANAQAVLKSLTEGLAMLRKPM